MGLHSKSCLQCHLYNVVHSCTMKILGPSFLHTNSQPNPSALVPSLKWRLVSFSPPPPPIGSCCDEPHFTLHFWERSPAPPLQRCRAGGSLGRCVCLDTFNRSTQNNPHLCPKKPGANNIYLLGCDGKKNKAKAVEQKMLCWCYWCVMHVRVFVFTALQAIAYTWTCTFVLLLLVHFKVGISWPDYSPLYKWCKFYQRSPTLIKFMFDFLPLLFRRKMVFSDVTKGINEVRLLQ